MEVYHAIDATFIAAKKAAEQRQLAHRKWATRTFVVRAAVALGILIFFATMWALDLIAPGLAKCIIILSGGYIAIWAGAWLQFMYAEEGGLLDAEK